MSLWVVEGEAAPLVAEEAVEAGNADGGTLYKECTESAEVVGKEVPRLFESFRFLVRLASA